MTRWYRAYEGTTSDPKIAEAALATGFKRSVVFAMWHAILESAAQENEGGRFDLPARRAAAVLDETIEATQSIFAAFDEIGLTKDSVVVAWAKRQFESDNSTGRVRNHRQRHKEAEAAACNDHVTLRNVSGLDVAATKRPHRTDTESSAPSERAPEAPEPDPADLASIVFSKGLSWLTRTTGKAESTSRAQLGRWRQKHGDAALLEVLAQAQRQHKLEAIIDVVAWIEGAFRSRSGPNGNGRSNSASRQAASLDALARAGGVSRGDPAGPPDGANAGGSIDLEPGSYRHAEAG